MRQAERNRVCVCCESKLVHERLKRKHVSESSQRAQRAVAHGRIQQLMVGHFPARQIVDWHGIAVTVTVWLWNTRRR